MLAHVIGAEAGAVVELYQREPPLVLLGERIRTAVVLIEDAELHPDALLRGLRDSLTDFAFDARAFGAVARDIGFLNVAVAAHDLRRLRERDQSWQIDLAVETAEDHRGVFAGERALHPAFGGVAKNVERGAAQPF